MNNAIKEALVERMRKLAEESPGTNESESVPGTNHVALGPSEQKGVEEMLWGSEPENEPVGTKERSGKSEGLNSAAEDINVEDNLDLLARSFSNFGEASRTDKAMINQMFGREGKPGQYVTRAKTLVERVRDVAGRS